MFIQINIGRNWSDPRVTDHPDGTVHIATLSDFAWKEFQNDAVAVLLTAVNATMNYQPSTMVKAAQVETHTGTGTWDGVSEESAHLSLFADVELDHFALLSGGKSNEFAPGNVTNATEMVTFLLDTHLSDLAQAYGQDAIAFVVTDSHLATRS